MRAGAKPENRVSLLKIITLLFAMLWSLYPVVCAQPGEPFTDSRNNKTYQTVAIGSQTWMAENLNYEMPDSWCYENNPEYCRQYGRLYTYEAAKNACPAGWHTPTEEEWRELELFLGMSEKEVYEYLYRGEDIGAKLKSREGWNSEDGRNYGSNESGFNALPGGIRVFHNGSFINLGKQGYWWSSSRDVKFSWRRSLFADKTGIDRDLATLTNAYSVRCVKDRE